MSVVSPQHLEFRFAVGSAHPALPGHFPGHPMVPGALLLAHVLTGVSEALERPVRAIRRAKFGAILLPDETALVACDVKGGNLAFCVQAWRAEVLVTIARGVLHLGNDEALASPAASNGSVRA